MLDKVILKARRNFKTSTYLDIHKGEDIYLGCGNVIHPKYYKHLKKGAHQSHFGRQEMGWFLAD